MADLDTTPALTPESVAVAHGKIKEHIHSTPLLTNNTISSLASSPQEGSTTAPKINLFFKCENYQRIGAFKARGAFHAVLRLIETKGLEEVRKRGVVTHSSGNHAQALALVGHTFSIPAYIVMPTISTPSKIAGTQSYTDHVVFSGSTSQEREAKVAEIIESTGAILVPPYDHPDILLGQGTAGLEMHAQYKALSRKAELDAVMTPCGGGGLLSGTTVFFSDKPTLVFGAEPEFQGANDLERGLAQNPPKRIENVKTLTIGDGLRTPVGKIPWEIFTSGNETKAKLLQGVYSATEEQIKDAMKLVLERMKVFIEPSSAVPLAVILFNEKFRQWVHEEQQRRGDESWDMGVVFSGGNTTIEAIKGLFSDTADKGEERAEGKVGEDGKRVAENVAG